MSVFVTLTVTAPAAWLGVVHVMDVAEETETLVQALPPILTAAPLKNPVPVMVIAVPPARMPDVGDRLETTGELFDGVMVVIFEQEDGLPARSIPMA